MKAAELRVRLGAAATNVRCGDRNALRLATGAAARRHRPPPPSRRQPAVSAFSGGGVARASPAPRAAAEVAAPHLWWLRKCGEASSEPPAAPPSQAPSSSAAVSTNPTTAGSSTEWIHGRLAPAGPELRAALQPLAALCGADGAALARAVACLPRPLQQRTLQHGCSVARFLLGFGVPQEQLAELLSRCLTLFGSPPEQKAGPLLQQLAAAGLQPAEAARCLAASPAAASAASFQPALQALAELLAAGSSSGSGSRAADQHAVAQLQAAGQLLRAQPEAASLLRLPAEHLHARAANLLSLGLDAPQLTSILREHALLLAVPPAELAERAEVLEEELGGGPTFFAALLRADPAGVAESEAFEVLEPHAYALAQEFGQEDARDMLLAAPGLLATPPSGWRSALTIMALCWVAHPRHLAVVHPILLTAQLASPRCVAVRIALQQAAGLLASEVYERLPACAVAAVEPLALATRLHMLQARQHEGVAVAAHAAVAEGCAGGSCEALRPLGMPDVCSLSDSQFAARLGVPAGRLQEEAEAIARSPGWAHVLAAADFEAARVRRLVQLEGEQAGAFPAPDEAAC